MEQGEIILYQPDDTIKLEVRMEMKQFWLSIEEMSNLFGRDISVIGKHIRNIFKEEELIKDSVWQNLPTLLLMVRPIRSITIILM